MAQLVIIFLEIIIVPPCLYIHSMLMGDGLVMRRWWWYQCMLNTFFMVFLTSYFLVSNLISWKHATSASISLICENNLCTWLPETSYLIPFTFWDTMQIWFGAFIWSISPSGRFSIFILVSFVCRHVEWEVVSDFWCGPFDLLGLLNNCCHMCLMDSGVDWVVWFVGLWALGNEWLTWVSIWWVDVFVLNDGGLLFNELMSVEDWDIECEV